MPKANIPPEHIAEYTKRGYWAAEPTMSDLWDRNARDYPEKEAIVDSKTRLTWSLAKQLIDRLALGFLELGLKRDEILAVQLTNSVELCLIRIACQKAGIVFMPLLRTLRHREMEYALKYVEAVGVVIPKESRGFGHFQMLEEIRPNLPTLRYVFVVDDDVPEGAISTKHLLKQPLEKKHPPDYLENSKCGAWEYSMILLTTGTTGLPKFTPQPICGCVYDGKCIAEMCKLTSEDIFALISPAARGPNAPAYFGAPLAAAKMVMVERFEAKETLKLIEKERITIANLVPAQLAMMLGHPSFDKYDLSSLRFVFCTGALLPYQIAKEAEEKMGCPILQAYGAMDYGGITMHSLDDPPEVRRLTVGRPWPGSEIKLVDDSGNEVAQGETGEIWVKGLMGIYGYYRDPQTTAQAWTTDWRYKTGDLGKWDDQGNLMIVGRKKEMIIRGGQNIYPVELENMLLSHPKVSDAAIVGMPDPVMGEKACAYVVLKPRQKFTFEDMTSFLREKNIASYKLPERLEIMDKLPMVGEQKIDKKVLQQDIAQKLKAGGIRINKSMKA